MTGDDIQQYRSTFEQKLQEHAHLGVYVDLTQLSAISKNALVDGTRADMELLSHTRQLGRCAIVPDKDWRPQTIASFAQQLFPDIDMRTFSEDREDEAWAWLEAELA